MSSNSAIAQFDHFIPVNTAELIRRLQQDETISLSEDQLVVIHRLKQILSYQFYLKLVAIKQLYLPLNPDNDLMLSPTQIESAEECIAKLQQLLTAANYSELNQEQIQYALQKTSPYGLEIGIDFDAFEHVSLFYRGKSQSSMQIRDWKTLFLKKKTIGLIKYQRIFLMLQFKDGYEKPGLHLKLFKDILRPDLEMLFPDSKVRMKAFDKLKLIVTGGGGTAGGLFATIGKVTAAVNPWTIFIAVAGFAMLIWRQVSKIFVQKTRYMATLAQNLYFHNLDNNAGAITYLIDLARQEEIKEVILAYALLCNSDFRDQEQLDNQCEQWFLQQFDQQIDFDISDAVDKLRHFNLVISDDNSLRCRSTNAINSHLHQLWQSLMDN